MPDPEVVDLSIADFAENHRQNIDVIRIIDHGLSEYNQSVQPDPDAAPLVLAIRSDDDRTVAGVTGRSAYGWMRVDVIWVGQSHRGKGLGQLLMSNVEQIARVRQCIGVHLDTHGFQAPGFYTRLGYEVFGELSDYPQGEKHYYFRKMLEKTGS